uniref:TerD domain-containing protein n=1 Tax=Pyrodinium bahamense TaxID=73915 RepID=A0A7S0A103_9DINO
MEKYRQAEDLELHKSRYGVGASWETIPGLSVDIDLQCVVVDSAGVIIDCAYYNNMKAVRAITHSGDEAAGKPGHIEEMVWMNMRKMPPNVSLLIFVVAAYAGGSLQDVANGRLHVFEENERNEVAAFEMERSLGCVDVVATIFKHGQGWSMRAIDLPAESGQHFMDISPLLSQVIREYIPSAPARQKVAFAMEKGGVLDLPMDLGRITVGLGWDVDDGECDLDVSAVLLDAEGRDLEAVFFGRLESPEHGIRHTGDNLTGEGDGDDEQITVSLAQIGSQVQQVVFVINIYTQNQTFAQVANPFCRVVDDARGDELCRYSLRDANNDCGLVIAKIAREAGGRWGFHALGLPCRGRTYKDSLPEIRRVVGLKTSSLAVRSPSNNSAAWPPQCAPTSPPVKSTWCAVQ